MKLHKLKNDEWDGDRSSKTIHQWVCKLRIDIMKVLRIDSMKVLRIDSKNKKTKSDLFVIYGSISYPIGTASKKKG